MIRSQNLYRKYQINAAHSLTSSVSKSRQTLMLCFNAPTGSFYSFQLQSMTDTQQLNDNSSNKGIDYSIYLTSGDSVKASEEKAR